MRVRVRAPKHEAPQHPGHVHVGAKPSLPRHLVDTIRTRRPRTYHLELPGAASRAVLWHCMPPRLAHAALGVASARLIAQIASRRDTPRNRASFAASSDLAAQSDANALATRTSCLHAAAPHNRSARDMV